MMKYFMMMFIVLLFLGIVGYAIGIAFGLYGIPLAALNGYFCGAGFTKICEQYNL